MEHDSRYNFNLTDDASKIRGFTIDRALAIWKTHKVPIALALISVVSIVTAIVLFIKSLQPASPIRFSENASSASISAEIKGIMVDIEGAVVRPGVYELPYGSRIDDLLIKAGGLASDADGEVVTKTINRAAKLADGAKIYIPKIGESTSVPDAGKQGKTTTGAVDGLISVNTATQAQLEALPGIGPVTAGKIIANRPYQTLEELVFKKAMSQSLFNKLREQLSL